jgi:hypothetical protein
MSRNLEPLADVTRRVVSIRREEDGQGYEVELACGHRSIWVVDPPQDRAYCSQCLDELIKRLKQT